MASQDEAKHPLAVNVDVQWQVTDVEKSMGVEQDNHIVNFKALPEFNLPKPAVAGKKLEWMPNHLAHLFWAIQRQGSQSGAPWNCEIQYRLVVPIVSAAAPVKSPIWTHGKADPIINAFQVRVPTIVNTVALKADDAVILRWTWPLKEERRQTGGAAGGGLGWRACVEGRRRHSSRAKKEPAKKRRT